MVCLGLGKRKHCISDGASLNGCFHFDSREASHLQQIGRELVESMWRSCTTSSSPNIGQNGLYLFEDPLFRLVSREIASIWGTPYFDTYTQTDSTLA